MTFGSSGNLRVHEVRHTGLMPFKCSFCGKEFGQLGSIHNHIRNHHGSYEKSVMNAELIIRQHGAKSKRVKKPKDKNERNNEEEYSDEYII